MQSATGPGIATPSAAPVLPVMRTSQASNLNAPHGKYISYFKYMAKLQCLHVHPIMSADPYFVGRGTLQASFVLFLICHH